MSLFGDDICRKALCIYNTVELAKACRRPPAIPALEGRPFLLCVAQHRRNKNIDLLLEVFPLMLTEGVISPQTALLVVGRSGPETASILRRITDLELQQRVLLLQGIADAELVWLYRNCELLLAPSAVEGFGLPIVEALQCGARVVCSDIPAFREVGGSNCSYFDLKVADPVGALVAGCHVALRKRHNVPVGLPQFSPQAAASAYISLYSQLLEKPRVVEANARRHVGRRHTPADGASVAS
jgi:glycosyltransferase involved in cell wall biosynthesis